MKHRLGTLVSSTLPAPSWKGWRALLLMLATPLLYKTTVAFTVVVSTLLLGGVSERRYEDLQILPGLGFSPVWIVLSVTNVVLLYSAMVVNLIFLANRDRDLNHQYISQEIVVYSYHCAQVGERKHGTVPVSKLCTAVITILLLLTAKEVETNAGPTHDIFPNDKHCQHRIITVPKASLMYREAALSIHIHGIKALSVYSKRTRAAHVGHKTKFSLSFTFHWLFKYKVGTECGTTTPVVHVHVHAVIVLKLMLAGDVETNPGPPGRLTLKNTRSMLYCVRAKWRNLGIELEIDVGTLDAIEKRFNGNPDDCLPEMLHCWLDQVNPRPSWNSLAEALESEPIGEGDLAEQIREKYNGLSANVEGDAVSESSGSHHHLELEASEKYCNHLKALYTASTQISDNKWPPTPSTEYINLACIDRETVTRDEADDFTKYTIRGNIDDICHRKSQISIDQVAGTVKDDVKKTVLSYPTIVLVMGAPGIGKTTFAWELCHRWAKGELLQDYSLVVLLRLRDKSAREAKELVDLFPYPERSLSKAVMNEMLENNGRGALFLLEGYDELPKTMRKESIYLDLIGGKLLPSATVLVTSRPWAVSNLRCKYGPTSRLSQWIEILGFTRQQIDEYLKSYSKNDRVLHGELRRYLSLNPPIHAAMYIPLNAVIVCEVYKEKHIGCVVPSTMTELYTAFSRILLIRYLRDHTQDIDRVGKLLKFEDLPKKVYQKFLTLCKLALEGINQKEQLTFSDLPDDFDSLGFMQSVPEIHVSSGVSVSYNFLHLTLQEFLAAYYRSLHSEHLRCSLPVSITYFLSGRTNRFMSNPSIIDKFLAGVTQLHDDHLIRRLPVSHSVPVVSTVQVSRDTIKPSLSLNSSYTVNTKTLSSCVKDLCACVRCNLFVKGNDPYCAWFYESQNIQKLNEFLGCNTVLIQITSNMTPMDCFAAGWCIGNSNCQWKLFFYGDTVFSLDCMEMLHAGIERSSLHQKHKVCDLCIGAGVMESNTETIRELCVLLKSNFDVMKVSIYCDCFCHNEHGYTYFEDLIKESALLGEVEIIVHSTRCCDTCTILQMIVRLVITRELKLETFRLKYGRPQHLHSFIGEPMCLTVLDLSEFQSNNYFVGVSRNNAERLVNMLKINKTLQVLKICGCGLAKEETTTLFQVFTNNQNTTLHTLDVSDNNYSVKELEGMLVNNTSLKQVEITVTPTMDPDASGLDNTNSYRIPYEFNFPGLVAYVGEHETACSVCNVIVSALTKNSTLQYLVINTLFDRWLAAALSKCQDYEKVKQKIKIVQSENDPKASTQYYNDKWYIL